MPLAQDLLPTEAQLARAEGRDYETAEQLLARIAAEQPQAKKTKPRRRSQKTTGARR